MTAVDYKAGNKVRIVKERVRGMNSDGGMDKYLGTVMTIRDSEYGSYRMIEDNQDWLWGNNMIAGYATEVVPVVHPDFEKWYTEIKEHYHDLKSHKARAVVLINQMGFGHGLEDSYGHGVSADLEDLRDEMQRNKEKYTRAVLDGYTIEKEKLYYVIFPKFERGEEYLNSYIDSEECMSADSSETSNIQTKFTEAEIRAIDERYWAFAVPVEEAD